MRGLFRKNKYLTAIGVLMILALAGCSSGENGNAASSDQGEKETVRVFIPGLSERASVDPVSGIRTKSLGELQAFLNEKIPDYNIELKTATWNGGWIQTMETLVTSGSVDVGFYTNQEAVPDWYMDLTPYLEKDPELNLDTLDDLFIEPAVHYTSYKSFNHPDQSGKIFGIPMTMACNVILYDSQIFKEWGVEEPNEDMTFSQLVELAEAVTGVNPTTGKKNYGAHLYSTWMEWYSLCYDAVKPYFSDTMEIDGLDQDTYIEYIRTSPEAEQFFTDAIRLVDCCNAAVATGNGAEKWLTDYNDIAINFDCGNYTKPYMNYLIMGNTEITDRYKALMCPSGQYGQSFPEFYRFAIGKKAANPDAAWEVVKALTTDKEIIDFYISNFVSDKLPCLNDTEGMGIMEYDLNQKRYEYQMNHMFVTDDYWYWRGAMQTVDNQILSKQYSVQEAVDAFYENVNAWVSNIRKQSVK